MKKAHTLRDQWFAAALKGLRPLFADIGYPLTAEVIRISTGFPSKGARGLKSRTIGQCWDATYIADGVCQIYISPVLVDAVKVLGVLVHELVHAAVGCQCGHKGPFRKAALAAGLTGTRRTAHGAVRDTGAVSARRAGPQQQEKARHADVEGDLPKQPL